MGASFPAGKARALQMTVIGTEYSFGPLNLDRGVLVCRRWICQDFALSLRCIS